MRDRKSRTILVLHRFLANPWSRPPSHLEDVPVIVVLGMHRSGTSAVTGMLEDHGIYLGPVRRGWTPNQPKGNREDPRVNKLNERVLGHNDGAWWRPPSREPSKFTRWHLWRRNQILADYGPAPFAIKDPRILLLLDFWRDLLERPIGVIRNPVSVRRSLRARRLQPAQLSDNEHLELWKTYNRRLLNELRRRPFPVIDFEDRKSFSEQVAAALRHYGFEPKGEGAFFDPEAVRHDLGSWRNDMWDRETVELWDELASYAQASGSP